MADTAGVGNHDRPSTQVGVAAAGIPAGMLKKIFGFVTGGIGLRPRPLANVSEPCRVRLMQRPRPCRETCGRDSETVGRPVSQRRSGDRFTTEEFDARRFTDATSSKAKCVEDELIATAPAD